MFNKKELSIILVVVLLLGFVLSLPTLNRLNLEQVLLILLSVFLVVMINLTAKKISANHYDTEIEIDLWKFKRYGFKPNSQTKKPVPAGIIFPLAFSVITLGAITWLASLVFETKTKVYGAAKRHGVYRFSEVSEFHTGMIAATGILANIIFAIIGYLLPLPGEMQFATISILFAFFNLIPISNLDGNKIFFGDLTVWSFLATIVLIGLGYIVLIP